MDACLKCILPLNKGCCLSLFSQQRCTSKLKKSLQQDDHSMAMLLHSSIPTKPLPLSFEQWFKLAKIYFQAGKYQECQAILNQNIRAHSSYDPMDYSVRMLELKTEYYRSPHKQQVNEHFNEFVRQWNKLDKPQALKNKLSTLAKAMRHILIGSTLVTTPAHEREIASSLKEARPIQDTMYVVSRNWYQKWCLFLQNNRKYELRPGPIIQFDIQDHIEKIHLNEDEDDEFLNSFLFETADTILIDRHCWYNLKQIYGGVKIQRKKTIKPSLFAPPIQVNLKPVLKSDGLLYQEVKPYVKSIKIPTVMTQEFKNQTPLRHKLINRHSYISLTRLFSRNSYRKTQQKSSQQSGNILRSDRANEYIENEQHSDVPIEVNTNYSWPAGTHGLANLGNTCYLNSCLQCLLHTDELTRLFLNYEDRRPLPNKTNGEFAYQYRRFITQYSQCKGKYPYKPDKLWEILQKRNSSFKNKNGHDAQECILTILNSLHEDRNTNIETPVYQILERQGKDTDLSVIWDHFYRSCISSQINDILIGQFKSVDTCNGCEGQEKKAFDHFFVVNLPLSKGGDSSNLGNSHFNSKNLQNCLNDFQGSLLVSYLCEKCQGVPTKRISIYQTKPILIFALPRFTMSFKKMNEIIEFPFELDMSHHIQSNNSNEIIKYELYAVIYHEGDTLEKGHYQAKCYNQETKQWIKYNDQVVSVVKCGMESLKSQIVTADASILWYRRKNVQ